MAETTSSASIAPAPAIEKPGTGALVAAGRRRRRYSVLTRHDKLILTLMVGVPLAFDLALIWAPALLLPGSAAVIVTDELSAGGPLAIVVGLVVIAGFAALTWLVYPTGSPTAK